MIIEFFLIKIKLFLFSKIVLAATNHQSNSGIIAVDDIEFTKLCKSVRSIKRDLMNFQGF